MSTVQIMVKAGLGGLVLGLAGCGLLPPLGFAAAAPVWTPALEQGACRDMAGERGRLEAVQAAMARQGLALRVLDCPQLSGPQVIAVTVIVLDGDRATHTVRGPLADGEAVDMGSAAAATAQKPAGDETLSPDVQHNRAWLRAAMAAQGFKPVAGWWWAFVPR